MKQKNTKKKILISTIVILLAICIIGISYALWSTRIMQTTINKVNSNCLELEFTDENDIALSNAIPITDSEAKELTPYTFVVKNSCNVSVSYDVNLEIMDATNRLSSEYVAVEINDNGKKLLSKYEETTPTYSDKTYKAVEARNLISGVIDGNKSISYSIRLWMDESVTIEDDVMNKIFASKISVNTSLNKLAETYTEGILNGTEPVISDYLIAVNIADDGTVTKADTTQKWYSYEDKEWANAVILRDKNITYEDGDTIPEDNIESYFVWIPKYSYQLWDLGEYSEVLDRKPSLSNGQEIKIKFGTTNTDDTNIGECTTPLVSGESGNCKVGSWMTHPAFINADTTGLWVGKFEIGYDGATSTEEAQIESDDSAKIIVKPNVYSWRSNSFYNFFMASYNYNRNLDSHMMKNTEWGAAVYLSLSKYGLNGKIYANNNNKRITGCVGTKKSDTEDDCLNAYNTAKGYTASTTGNITGIYDMCGGAFDAMATTTVDSSNYMSEFAKYFDIYNLESNISSLNYRILGDATGELGQQVCANCASHYIDWFDSRFHFISKSSAIFLRGEESSNHASQLASTLRATDSFKWHQITSRLVLAV